MRKDGDARTRAESEIQRDYYGKTAREYDGLHLRPRDPHFFALAFMRGVLDYLRIESVLDIGSGTGRVLSYLRETHPGLAVTGVEPVKELREEGYARGIPRAALVDGDATELAFPDRSFDLVCEFGVLHHIRHPSRAVAEMLRVAGKAVFISDSNNFGQGSSPARLAKRALRALGLWDLFNLVKTGGRGYTITEGDGLAYSYSVFNDYALIRKHCRSVHLLNTSGGGHNFLRSAGVIALLGIKR